MKVKIIGKETVNYTDKKTGYPAQFSKLHCISNFPLDTSNPSEGDMCLEVSCNPSILPTIPIGCTANLDFNQQGRLQAIDIIDDQ